MQHKVFNETFMVAWFSVKMCILHIHNEKNVHFSCDCGEKTPAIIFYGWQWNIRRDRKREKWKAVLISTHSVSSNI